MKTLVFVAYFLAAFSVSAVSLNVRFTSEGDDPAIKYVAVYNLADSSEIATADLSGIEFYTFEVPENTDIFVLGVASDGKSTSGYYLHEFLPVSEALSIGTEEKTVDFETEPSFQLVLQNVDFPSTGELFAVDMDDRFVSVFRLDVSDSAGKSLPSLNLPLGKCYAFYVLKELPVSGRMVYRIDNKGDGYCANSQGNLIIDTDKAVAESVISRYEELLSETVIDKTEYLEKLKEIEALYDSNDYRSAAGAAVFQSEELIFNEALYNINMYRKGHLTVNCKNGENVPAGGIKITAVPQKAEYKRGVLAGIYDLDPSIFENAVFDGFSFATVGTLWLNVEPEDDAYRWDYMDNVAGNAVIYDFGYELFGHSILYFLDSVMPEYLKEMDFETLKDEVAEHTTDLVGHYIDSINEWLLINEAHSYSASGGFSREEITEITKTVSGTVAKTNPQAVRTINAAPDFFGQNRYAEMFIPDHEQVFSMNIYDYFEDLIESGINFEVIGQQLYDGGCVTLFKDNGLSDSASAVTLFDLVEIRRQLKRTESLGKPVYVTEISVPSAMNSECPDMGYWRNEWDEDVQAQFLDRLVSIIMGEKDVHAVTYWDMQDKGSFIYRGGLMDETGRKKASYEKISSLFGSFTETVSAVTDENGVAELNLFAGDYEISVDGEAAFGKVTVEEAENVSEEYILETDISADGDSDLSIDEDAVNRKEKGCSVISL